jgi:hypothetical protein
MRVMPRLLSKITYCENTFQVPVGSACWECLLGVPVGSACWECLLGVPVGSACWEVTLRLRDVVLDSEQDRSLGLSRVSWVVGRKALAFRFALFFLDILPEGTLSPNT